VPERLGDDVQDPPLSIHDRRAARQGLAKTPEGTCRNRVENSPNYILHCI